VDCLERQGTGTSGNELETDGVVSGSPKTAIVRNSCDRGKVYTIAWGRNRKARDPYSSPWMSV